MMALSDVIMFWVWLATVPLVLWAGMTIDFGITWGEYPSYLRKHMRQAWLPVNIVCWAVMWVEVFIKAGGAP